MILNIYQAYYKDEHLKFLDPDLIPYDNVGNNSPLLEYSIWKELHKKHQGDSSHWGVLSWRYKEKIPLPAKFLKGWINCNEGADVYHVNPYFPIITCTNLWLQGDACVPGMVDYINLLLKKLGYNFDIRHFEYTADEYSTCHYFMGNDKFWSRYLAFIDNVIEISKQDPLLNNYMFVQQTDYRDGRKIINFPFVVERLFTMFCIFNPDIKVKQYPYDSFVYNQPGYEDLLNFYYDKKSIEENILYSRQQLLQK